VRPYFFRRILGDDDVGLPRDHFCGGLLPQPCVAGGPAIVNLNVFAFHPSEFPQLVAKRSNKYLSFLFTFGLSHQQANPSVTYRWLGVSAKCAYGSRTAKKSDKLAPPHSITSLAMARSLSGIVRPSALAVVRLMTRSNSVGCSTGMSAGFVPRGILSSKSAARADFYCAFARMSRRRSKLSAGQTASRS
jgi:hypothetical protein